MLRDIGILPWLVIATTLVTCAGFGSIGPFAVQGYAWVLLFVAAAFHFLGQGFRTTFPLGIWIPWFLLLATGLILSNAPNALQRTAMMVCPCIVGAAVAALPVHEAAVVSFVKVCKGLLFTLIAVLAVRAGVLATGRLPELTGLAGESMTAVLLAALFAAEAAGGSRGAISFLALALAIPVLTVVRGAMVAGLATIPFSLHPMRHGVRFAALLVAGVAAALLFHSERVQKKMFRTGSGQIAEVRLDNPNLDTAGRASMWERLEDEARKKPWFGHGTNAHEEFIRENIGPLAHPHNDWLRLFFDFGYVGAGLFGLTILAQTLHALRAARRAGGARRLCLYAGASAFIPFAMLMGTDNVLLYAGFFGNLHFALLGLGYSAALADPWKHEQPFPS